VVGTNADGDAALFENGVWIDLSAFMGNSDFVSLDSARAINDAGEIVGYGTTASGATHAFLLTPDSEESSSFPEPPTLTLAGLGLAIAYFRRSVVGHSAKG
jgi:probable HAF family extracellular repeat protein